MRPILFSLGSFHLAGYGAMIILGGAIVFGLLYPRRAELGLKSEDEFWIFLNVTLFSGPFSGRVLYVFEYTRPFSEDFWRALFSFNSNYSMLGCFIGMPLAFWTFARWCKIPFGRFFDGACLMACVWHIFGRLGCFLAGCCHGRPTTWPWGIAFTDPRSQVFPGWLGVPLHPTQLIEAAGDAVIAFFLYKLFRREGGSGRVAAAFFGLYGLLRFSVEFLRGDTVPLPIGLTAGQVLSLGLMVGSSAFWVWRISHPPRR